MSGTWSPETEERRGLPRISLLAVMVAGVLAVGGGVGLALNHAGAPAAATPEVIPGDPATDPLTPASTSADAAPAPTLVRSTIAAPRVVEVMPPENPFLRTAADPAVFAPAGNPGSVSVTVAAPAAPVARPSGTPAAAAPARPAPAEPSAPNADDLALTGIVQGEPPVAVVRYSGQSLFLKIGDQVADTWRLVEIKERSAIFQLGAQRVEIPIKGGSSE